jgi:hypothetical protein
MWRPDAFASHAGLGLGCVAAMWGRVGQQLLVALVGRGGGVQRRLQEFE